MRICSLLKRLLKIVIVRYKRFFLYFIAIISLSSVFWLCRKFGNPSIEQFIFHFQVGTDGLDKFGTILLFNYLKNCILVPFICAFIVVLVEEELKKYFNKKDIKIHRSVVCIFGKNIPIYIFLSALIIASMRFGLLLYLDTTSNVDFIKENYINPKTVTLVKGNNKNLILIYVESLEKNYSNTSLFDRNLLEPLDKIEGVEFEKFAQMPGTGWTIAGMVSSQCGIPLKPLILADGNSTGELVKDFLPNATCLGDTLSQLGYENVFIGGASLSFSGKENFLITHGYTRVMGKKEWVSTGKYKEDEMSQWGLHDDSLMKEARVELDRLFKTKKLFNLTILTLDTHFPKGFISETCSNKGVSSFEDIVDCSVKEVSDFINYAKAKGYLKNTNIVVLGDHLSMPNPVYKKLIKVERQIYSKWISEEACSVNRAEIIHFDIAPTILEFIGVKVIGDRYGLGYSGLFQSSDLPSKNRNETYIENLSKRSDFYKQLWFSDKL